MSTTSHWIAYKVTNSCGKTFTHFSKHVDTETAQQEWEKKFSYKATSIALDDDDTELDFFDLLEEE